MSEEVCLVCLPHPPPFQITLAWFQTLMPFSEILLNFAFQHVHTQEIPKALVDQKPQLKKSAFFSLNSCLLQSC